MGSSSSSSRKPDHPPTSSYFPIPSPSSPKVDPPVYKSFEPASSSSSRKPDHPPTSSYFPIPSPSSPKVDPPVYKSFEPAASSSSRKPDHPPISSYFPTPSPSFPKVDLPVYKSFEPAASSSSRKPDHPPISSYFPTPSPSSPKVDPPVYKSFEPAASSSSRKPDHPPISSYFPTPSPSFPKVDLPVYKSFEPAASSSSRKPDHPPTSSYFPIPSPSSPKVDSPVYKSFEPAASSSSRKPDHPPISSYFPTPSPSFPKVDLPVYKSFEPAASSSSRKPDHPPISSYFPTPSPSSPKVDPPVYKSFEPAASSSSRKPDHPPISSYFPTPSPSSPKVDPPVYKSFEPAASSSSNVKDDSLPAILITENIKALIKKDIVPKVLNHPLSPTTYKDYFAALLYSEVFFLQKWSDFVLKGVTLELDESAIYKNGKLEDKNCVAFELHSVPEKCPYLISGHSVFARPVGNSTAVPFKGSIYIILEKKRVLVEFEDGFYYNHHSSKTYDVSFSSNIFSKKKKKSISFNRVCLERDLRAVKVASEALFQNFLFPDCDSRASIPTAPPLLSTTCHKLDQYQRSAVGHILRIRGSPPYVVTGPLCEVKSNLTRTGKVVSEAVYQLCQKSPEYRILICAPTNSCCDVLMRSMVKVIPESTMFRVNAPLREKEEVPEDILRSSLYKKKQSCFSCPPIKKLRTYRVIFSTSVSSFRLHDEGIAAGHFSHIFLVDASSAIEPETLVPLTYFADKTTSVIVTGKPGNSPCWLRAEIARNEGLKISYFERLCKLRPYSIRSPMFISQLDPNQK